MDFHLFESLVIILPIFKNFKVFGVIKLMPLKFARNSIYHKVITY